MFAAGGAETWGFGISCVCDASPSRLPLYLRGGGPEGRGVCHTATQAHTRAHTVTAPQRTTTLWATPSATTT